MVDQLTDEQKADIEQRKKQFLEKYEALTKELEIDFAQYPAFMPLGNGMWGVMTNAVLQDKKYLAPLSPIQS